jgi:hypothetical protein
MPFNATFNNISAISWQSVLLVEYPEKTTVLSQVTDKLYHIICIEHTSPDWDSKEKVQKRQKIIYKTLHRKLQIEQH